MRNAYSKISPTWPVTALVYGFIVLTQFDHIQLMGIVSPSDVFLVLLFCVLFGAFMLSHCFPRPKMVVSFLSLVVLGALSSLLSPTPSESMRGVISLIGMGLTFIVTYWLLRSDERWLRRMTKAFIFAGLTISITAWMQWLAYQSGRVLWQPVIYGHQQLSGVVFLEGRQLFRVTAFYFDPNFLAFYLLPPLIFGYFHFLEAKNDLVKRIVLSMVLVIILGAFVLTFSRGQFLALLVTGVLGLWFSRKRWSNVFIMMLLLMISAGVIVVVDLGAIVASLQHFNPEAIATRLTAWKQGWLEVIESPLLGVGMGVPIFNPYKMVGNPMMEEHNAYLQIARGTGVIGLLIFLVLLARPAIHVLQSLRYTRDMTTAAYKHAFIALLFGAFSINALLIKHFWIILAVQYVLIRKSQLTSWSSAKGT